MSSVRVGLCLWAALAVCSLSGEGLLASPPGSLESNLVPPAESGDQFLSGLSVSGAGQFNNDLFTSPFDDPNAPQNSTVTYSQQMGDFGSVSFNTNPDPENFNFGAAHYYAPENDWLKSIETRVDANEYQTVFNIGATVSLWEEGRHALYSRVLGGYGVDNEGNNQDTYNWTVDLFGIAPLTSGNSHWIKAGAFIDQQEDFRKAGPELGLLLFADYERPLTIDMAWGIGYSETQQTPSGTLAGADHDVQLRVGTILRKTIQVGGTVQYLDFDQSGDSWNGGAFFGFPALGGQILVDGTLGDQGPTGFIRYALLFGTPQGSPVLRSVASRGQDNMIVRGQAPTNDGMPSIVQTWASTPVNRSTAVAQKKGGASPGLPGNLTVTYIAGPNMGSSLPGSFLVMYQNTTTANQMYTLTAGTNSVGTPAITYFSNILVIPSMSLPFVLPTISTGAGPYTLPLTITVDGVAYNVTVTFPNGAPSGTVGTVRVN